MAMWNVDLTTRTGAEKAARAGGVAAFVFAVLGLLGAGFYGVVVMKTNPAMATGAVFGGLLEGVVGAIAGFRLRGGQGFIWGGATLVLVVLEEIGKIVELRPSGLVIGVILAIYLTNGVRGAYALRRGRFADEDVFG